jgi:dephospho-CoA kinase
MRPDATIDRAKLAAEVFGNPERLARLNQLVHPAVFRREQELTAQYEGEDPHAIIVVEAAIMIEAGSYRRYDCLIVAVCTEEQQIERAMRRDGATRETVLARVRSQMPLREKRKFADYVIDTSESKEHTRRQAAELYELLKERESTRI